MASIREHGISTLNLSNTFFRIAHSLATRLAEAHGVHHKLDAILNLDQEKVKELSRLRLSQVSKRRLSVPISKSAGTASATASKLSNGNGGFMPTPIATPQDSPKSTKAKILASAAAKRNNAQDEAQSSGSEDLVNRSVLQNLFSYAHWSKILCPPSQVIGMFL